MATLYDAITQQQPKKPAVPGTSGGTLLGAIQGQPSPVGAPAPSPLARTAVPQPAGTPTPAPIPSMQAVQPPPPPAPGTPAAPAAPAQPQFNQAWMGTKADWNAANPAEAWQRILAVHGGNMTPEQKQFALKQAQSGGSAFNPFGAGGSGTMPGAGGAPAAPGLPTGAGQALSGATTAGGQIQQGQQTNVAGAFQQALVNRLTGGSSPLDASNPEIKGAVDANKLAEQRGFERDRAMLAERGAAQGFDNSGGFETELRSLAQNRTAREGQFEGAAVRDLAVQRANELTQALMLGGGMLGDQDKLAMQEELARLDASLRQKGLDVQSRLGSQDLALRDKLGSGQLNLGLLGSLMQNSQFNKNLGANLGMFNAGLNQTALLNLFR